MPLHVAMAVPVTACDLCACPLQRKHEYTLLGEGGHGSNTATTATSKQIDRLKPATQDEGGGDFSTAAPEVGGRQRQLLIKIGRAEQL